MEFGKWYIVSDSGSIFTSQGFPSLDDARKYWLSHEFREHHDEPVLHCPSYDKSAAEWTPFESCNVVLADDLFHYYGTLHA